MAPKDKMTPDSKPKTRPAMRSAGKPETTPNADPTASKTGERIAKVLSRRGVASRREAERLIEAGEVKVNGKVITSPALNVSDADRILVSGKPLPDAEAARLWLYYKPEGLVTSASDEKGRDTVFDHLPDTMPRVMSVGRLDLNSEGLLLLTNDGELKRRLELPSTGWLRKYRVRVNGAVDDLRLQVLREGVTVEGERFRPMQVTIDRQQGSNAWLTVGLREGKNREIRRAMNEIGLFVNRLIRVSYGPFRLGDLQPGEAEEVKARVLREQLGEIEAEAAAEKPNAPLRPLRPGAPSRSPGGRSPAPVPNRIPATGSFRPNRRAPRAEGEVEQAEPQALRPGEGVKSLSRSWKEATTPHSGDKPRQPRGAAAAAETRSPTGAASARPAYREDSNAETPAGRVFAKRRAISEQESQNRKAYGKLPGPRAATADRPAAKSAARSEARSEAKPAGKAFASSGSAKPAGAKPAGERGSFGKSERGAGPAKSYRAAATDDNRSTSAKPRSTTAGRDGAAKPRSGRPSTGPKRPPRSRG